MDKTQADAIAQALLEPDLRAQEELRRKRASVAQLMAKRGQVVWSALVGFAIGAIAAYFVGQRWALGAMWGCIVGAALGRLILELRSKSRAV
jgi:L-fucose isomerase-like protein